MKLVADRGVQATAVAGAVLAAGAATGHSWTGVWIAWAALGIIAIVNAAR